IKKMGASGTTEIHVLDGASGYGRFLWNTATALRQTGTDNGWEFRMRDWNGDGILDAFAIKKNGAGGLTEVHVLNGADSFRTFLVHIATALPSTGIDHAWEFEFSP
ncbi:MAG: hypothetical protein ACR2J7_02695, partial [Luteimonas sp.]